MKGFNPDAAAAMPLTDLFDLADETFNQVQAAAKCHDEPAAKRHWERYAEVVFVMSLRNPETLAECGQLCSFAGALITAQSEGIEIGDGFDAPQMLATCNAWYETLLEQQKADQDERLAHDAAYEEALLMETAHDRLGIKIAAPTAKDLQAANDNDSGSPAS